MNSLTKIVLVALAILAVNTGFACWYPIYEPVTYYTCRIFPAATPRYGASDYDMPEEMPETEGESMAELWQRTLLPGISLEEINRVIGESRNGYSISKLKKLEVSPELRELLAADNKALLEYVCVMRQVNHERKKLTDPWYYHYEGNPVSKKLNALADTCIKRLDTRYGDRYAVLAGRALNSLKRYDDIEEIARSHAFKDKEMEALFQPEYAGVLYKLERYEEALDIYAKTDDSVSIRWCLCRLGDLGDDISLKIGVISRLANYESNYDRVAQNLQLLFKDLENIKYGIYHWDEYNNVGPRSIEAIINCAHEKSQKADKYQPLWRYSEAMAHLLNNNDFAAADSVLALINTRNVDDYLGKSIRTLRFITQSKMKPYNDKYLSWLASEAEWLIAQSDEQIKELGDYNMDVLMPSRNTHFSTLYFSDMLHKAADCIIVPRMLEHGDTVAAMQLLDIVDYANFDTSQFPEISDSRVLGNASACFAMKSGADVIIEGMNRSQRPKTALDRLWKKTGSIRDLDRWNDFAGTALIGEGRYREAVKYLEKVSEKYGKEMSESRFNAYLNPFSIELQANNFNRGPKSRIKQPDYYKLWFARKMVALEDRFNNKNLDADKRAKARLDYGIGMANSIYPCWSLTRYGFGWYALYPWEDPKGVEASMDNRELAHDFHTEDRWYGDIPMGYDISKGRLKNLHKLAMQHIDEAIKGIKDREAAVVVLKKLGNYRTIKYHYADTRGARELKSKCDRWEMW